MIRGAIGLAAYVSVTGCAVGSAAASALNLQPPPDSTPRDRAADAASKAAAPRVLVSLPPLIGLTQPFVDAVTGSGGARPVASLVPVGRSEHGYEITPSRLAELLNADMVVLVGLGLEPQIERFLKANPPADGRGRRVIRFADVVGIADEGGGGDGHDHEHHHHHEDGTCDHHHGTDPHLWLDPVLVERLVGEIERGFAEIVAADAAAAARVRVAGERLRGRVREIHERYALTCGGFASKTIVVGHDAWGRMAERYGLETVAISGLMAGEPTPAALERAKATVKERNLRVVFVEPQLSDKAGRRIAAATGAEVRKLDPLGAGDWFAMMESNLREIERALGGSAGGGKSEPNPPAQQATPGGGGAK